MPEIRRGLRIEDDDYEVPKYEKQSLDADRKRSNFQKDMDDMLFGGGARPVRRHQKPTQQAKKPVEQPPKKPQEPAVKTPSQPNRSIDNSRSANNVNTSSTRAPNKQVEDRRPPVQVQPSNNNNNKIDSTRSIGIHSKVNIRENNYVEPEPEPVIEEQVIEQPHHEEPKVEPEQKVEVGGSVFNRPQYIRKLKKIAEEFNFAQENAQNHQFTDVLRPFECERNRMRKFNEENFIDHEFPPSSYSLGAALRNQPSEWRRHSEFAKKSCFGRYIDPNDINPGKLSSPQFLSTLSALAQMQGNIKRLIQDQKSNSNGFYLIRLIINGVWRYIPVDDKLPFSNGEAMGAQSFNDNESQLWAALIEKAYAKVYGGWDVFSRNTPREHFLRDLTGAPVRKYLSNDGNLAQVIRTAISNGQVIVAVPRQNITALGLNPNYSLSVINCKNNGGLELRNSWGTIQERSGVNMSKEGVFELSSNQTRDYISYVMVAETNSSYYTSTIQSKHKGGFYSCYKFRLEKECHGYLTLSQWDGNLLPESVGYEYSVGRIVLQKRGSGTAEDSQNNLYVNSAFSHSARNLDLEVNLLPGDYEVFVAVHWVSKEYDYDLTFNGSERVTFQRIYTNSIPNRICSAFTALNLQSGKRSALGHCSQFIQYHKDSNLVLVTAENTSDKEYLFNQDFTKVNFGTLHLLNAKNNEETYENLTGEQIDEYKGYALDNRKWSVSIGAKGTFTWVISTSEDYNEGNFRKWGFR